VVLLVEALVLVQALPEALHPQKSQNLFRSCLRLSVCQRKMVFSPWLIFISE
jgi:hypothetical protein